MRHARPTSGDRGGGGTRRRSLSLGVPDETRGEVVKAEVTPNEECEPGETLRAERQTFMKAELTASEYPRELECIDAFERTVGERSGVQN